MRAGKLDRRITIESATLSVNAVGESVKAWATLDTVWAGVSALSGKEYVGAAQVVGEEQLIFRIRYRTDVTLHNRIIYNSEEYDIQHIAEVGRRQGLDLVGKRT